MGTAFIVLAPMLFAALQVMICFAVGRNLWPVLRKHAPRMLAYRGVPYFLGIVVLLLFLPATLFIAIASHYVVAKSLIVALLRLTRFWIAGFALGLSVAIYYYGAKDLENRWRRRRSALPTPRG